MKIALALCLFLFVSFAHAEDGSPELKFDLDYGFGQIHPSQLNDYRSQFLWGSPGTPSGGTFSLLNGIGVEFGYKLLETGYLNLRYAAVQQSLSTTGLANNDSIQDSFIYQSFYIIYDYLFPYGDWTFSAGGGLGYALKFEYHQIEAAGENVAWRGNPVPLQIRGSAAYAFTPHLSAIFNLSYEYVKASLTSASAYSTTINGVAIASGQALHNTSNGTDVTADLSGFREELGLRVTF